MGKILKQNFFNRDAKIVAEELLGKFLVRKIGKKEIACMITETESYDGPNDKASHAHKGRTPRTEVMFGPAGRLYVYFCYGMHHMLNVVTGPQDYPAAVLIRGAKQPPFKLPTSDLPAGKAGIHSLDGPGKLTKYLKINKSLNGEKAEKRSGVWFENRGVRIKKSDVLKTPRVGVAYAGPVWSKKKMRFVLKNRRTM